MTRVSMPAPLRWNASAWSSVVSRGRLRRARHDLLGAPARLYVLVPQRVVLLRPGLVDVAVLHRAPSARDHERAHVGMAEAERNEEDGGDDVDRVGLLHRDRKSTR